MCYISIFEGPNGKSAFQRISLISVLKGHIPEKLRREILLISCLAAKPSLKCRFPENRLKKYQTAPKWEASEVELFFMGHPV